MGRRGRLAPDQRGSDSATNQMMVLTNELELYMRKYLSGWSWGAFRAFSSLQKNEKKHAITQIQSE